MEITIDACQSEAVNVIRAAVLLGNDVLDMQGGKRRIILMQLAVFATIAGAPGQELLLTRLSPMASS